MTSQFPGALDNFTNPTPADNLNTPAVLHSDQHSNENDAIEAIEAWVGVSGTSAQSSHEYRIVQLENTPPGADNFGFVGWDEGVPLGTGTVLNIVGQDVVMTRSGTVLQLTHTNPAIAFPQELIGVYGTDDGVPLGTGTVLDFGNNLTASLSGTVLRIDASGGGGVVVFPQELIGIYGQDEAVGLGTGTTLNVVGEDIQLSLSGTVLTIQHTNPAIPAITFPQSQIGIFAQDEGIPLGTGTIINFVGQNVDATISGTVIRVFVTGATPLPFPPFPQELIGIYGTDEGVPLGTGTTLDVVGENISLSLSGNVLQLSHTNPAIVFPQEVIGVMGQDEGVPLGTGSTLNVVGNNIVLSLSGTVLQLTHTDTPITFPQEVIGIFGQDEGINLGTGTILNVTGENVSLSLSGTVLNLSHTNPTIAFPQELIGIMGWNAGIPLATGTVLDVSGSRLVLSSSGTVLRLSNSPDPQELIGLVGMNKSSSLGTGTTLNVSGTRIQLTKNGDVLELTNSPDPQSQIGVMGWNQGIPLGTGTVLNINGSRLFGTISGTVLQLSNSPDPAELIGIMGVNQGTSLGTGTVLSVTGSRLSMSLVGNTLNLTSSPDPAELIGIMAWDEGAPIGTGTVLNVLGTGADISISGTVLRLFITGTPGAQGAAGTPLLGVMGKNNGTNLGTGTTLDAGAELNFAITGTTLYMHPFDGGVNGDAWVKNTGSAQLAGWVNQDYNIQFYLGDGSNTISTGSTTAGYGYVEIPVNSIIESWTVFGDATGSIVTNIYKSTYAGFPPTTLVSGLGQPLMTNLRNNTGNATGTATASKGDVVLLEVSSVSTLKLATVSLQCRKNATS